MHSAGISALLSHIPKDVFDRFRLRFSSIDIQHPPPNGLFAVGNGPPTITINPNVEIVSCVFVIPHQREGHVPNARTSLEKPALELRVEILLIHCLLVPEGLNPLSVSRHGSGAKVNLQGIRAQGIRAQAKFAEKGLVRGLVRGNLALLAFAIACVDRDGTITRGQLWR